MSLVGYSVRLVAPPTAADAGQVRETLEQAEVGAIRWALNSPGSCSFTLPTRSFKTRRVRLAEEEIQVYRGGRRIFWGVPLRAVTRKGTTEIQCLGLLWYLSKRHVGDANRTNYLENGDFERNKPGVKVPHRWATGADGVEMCEVVASNKAVTGKKLVRMTETRVVTRWLVHSGKGAAKPHTTTARLCARRNVTRSGTARIVDGRRAMAGNRVLLTGQSNKSTNGIWVVAAGDWTRPADYNQAAEIKGSRVKVTEGKTLAGTGWRNTNTNKLANLNVGQDGLYFSQYARTEFSPRDTFITQVEDLKVGRHRGTRWTAKGLFRVRSMKSAPLNERGLMIILRDAGNAKFKPRNAVFRITDDTDIGRLLPAEASIRIPRRLRDPRVTVRLYCPVGSIDWDHVGLYYRERLLRGETDVATAMKRLVRHAQDPRYGKSTLGVGTKGPLSSVDTGRQFWHDEHDNILQALDELSKGPGGPDFHIDEDTRRFVVHPLGRGTVKDNVRLTVNRNTGTWEFSEDAEDICNVVIGLGPGEGAARSEAAARRTGSLSGMVYEKVTPLRGPIRQLKRRAAGIAERGQKPRKTLRVTTFERGDRLIDALEPGDVVPVLIAEGRAQIDGTWRVTSMELTARDDALSLDLDHYQDAAA